MAEKKVYHQVIGNPNGENETNDYVDLTEEREEKEADNTEEFRKILGQVSLRVQERNQEVNPNGPSGGFTSIANTVELLFRQERDEELIGGGVNTGGTNGKQGMNVYYHPEHKWFVANTTSGAVVKPTSPGLQSSNLWTPWSDYATDTDKEAEPRYKPKKFLAVEGLTSLVSNNVYIDAPDHRFSFNDTWLEDAYQHIRNDGGIQPIIQPLKYAIDKQIQENEKRSHNTYTGVYGENIQVSHITCGENLEQLHQQIMFEEETITTEQIHQHLGDKTA